MNHSATDPFERKSSGLSADESSAVPLPQAIGRYRVEKLLGQGGFGIVYLAYDDQLQRRVAIKVPHRHRVSKPEDAKPYLTEARTVANLDHPNIVPVHDVGSSEEFPCFVVSKFIEGRTLAQLIADDRAFVGNAVTLVATIAETLHYAHGRGLVHRDIKPGNILLDSGGKPYVADFGLALKEENLGHGPKNAGTTAYMSPEQARGEGHRVDGRSDIFSLGVVLYELLTGRRPFHADKKEELLEQIISFEARPPRQFDDQIPKEVERICLKALAKRASERYTTAKDMADDLRNLLQEATQDVKEKEALQSTGQPIVVPPTGSATTAVPTTMPTSATDQQPIRIVPKGLRSFDAQDADFFLELLPGPRDRAGLPDSIRFWKTRIEETDPDNTFPVGLIYGPSGCGKSSLLKAGLLPRLSKDVIVVFVEASAEETETRLLNGLHKKCPGLARQLDLTETLAALRRGHGIPAGKKLLIVLDQFEQWLHAKANDQNPELVQALRHCDGGRVQCLLMVRDDFWLAISRFMRDLEADLVPGRNIALADLFDLDHARKVLTAFGRAFDRLPETPGEKSKEQKEFLNQAIAGLAQENKVICVRLALFAEMVKGRPWTTATLKEIGGAEGVGATFLEDTFSSATANPKHRLHQKAARAVLKALLPETGSDIKGNMRSQADLLAASGYASRRKDFEDLIHILDSETRLITPTDPEGSADESPAEIQPGKKYYQLTHDYLVHSLRDWLTRKQKETRQGRAELRLADRAALWNAKPETHHLPSPDEYARIRLFTRSPAWTQPQRKMMRRADRYYLGWCAGVVACLIILGWAAWEYSARRTARELFNRILDAKIAKMPEVLDQVEPWRHRVEPMLLDAVGLPNCTDEEKLRINLALVRSDHADRNFLYERLVTAKPQDFDAIREVLRHDKDKLIEQLLEEMQNSKGDRSRRFRAACALVDYVGRDEPLWNTCAANVAKGMLAQSPVDLIHWKEALKPAQRELLPALAESLEDNKWVPRDRQAITEIYREFAVNDPADFEPLQRRLSVELPGLTGPEQAKRKAAVAAALVSLRKGDTVWRLLIHTSNPTPRSYLIERLGESGADPSILINQLNRETETSARFALILALGSFPDRLPDLEAKLFDWYENDNDAGIHGAAGWVLRKWGQGEQLGVIDAKLATGKVEGKHGWYVSTQGQTLSIVKQPKRLIYGLEKFLQPEPHRYAIGATEVTVRQYQSVFPKYTLNEFAKTLDSPVNNISWYDAAAYCNWLTKKDGLGDDQLCYKLSADGRLDFVDKYWERKGYRLPTEDEWEFACRAGTRTPWCFGTGDNELLGKYACWFGSLNDYRGRSFFRVGSLKPNDFGLFDMHGNASEWCQEYVGPKKSPQVLDLHGRPDVECSYRGGYFLSAEPDVASDHREPPTGRSFGGFSGVGFRVVRTMP
jgi:serine/threonine protein kinase